MTQVEIFELISNPNVQVDDFGFGKIEAIADILDGSRDVTAGHVVWCSRATKWPILTDRADNLRAFDQNVGIDPLP